MREERGFKEALHRLGNSSTNPAAGIPQIARNTWGHIWRATEPCTVVNVTHEIVQHTYKEATMSKQSSHLSDCR